jgi:hypothetical protein
MAEAAKVGSSQGVFVAGKLGGLEVKHMEPDREKGESWEPFDKVFAWMSTGGRYSVTVTAHRGENDEFRKALEPLVGRQVIVEVWPDNFREMHFLGVVGEQ